MRQYVILVWHLIRYKQDTTTNLSKITPNSKRFLGLTLCCMSCFLRTALLRVITLWFSSSGLLFPLAIWFNFSRWYSLIVLRLGLWEDVSGFEFTTPLSLSWGLTEFSFKTFEWSFAFWEDGMLFVAVLSERYVYVASIDSVIANKIIK